MLHILYIKFIQYIIIHITDTLKNIANNRLTISPNKYMFGRSNNKYNIIQIYDIDDIIED